MLEQLRQHAAAAEGYEETPGDEDRALLHISIEGDGSDGQNRQDRRQREGDPSMTCPKATT